MSKVRPSGKSVVLISRGNLAPTCARVGCMPSKVIQIAEDFLPPRDSNAFGVEGHERSQRDVSEAWAMSRDLRDVRRARDLQQHPDKMPDGMFVAGYTLRGAPICCPDNGRGQRMCRTAIIATGSRPIVRRPGDHFVTASSPPMTFESRNCRSDRAVTGPASSDSEIGRRYTALGCKVVGIDMQT